jgi:subtilisin family serine protease
MRYYIHYNVQSDVDYLLLNKKVISVFDCLDKRNVPCDTVLIDENVRIINIDLDGPIDGLEMEPIRQYTPSLLFDTPGPDPIFGGFPFPNEYSNKDTSSGTRIEYYPDFSGNPLSVQALRNVPYEQYTIDGNKKMVNPNQKYLKVDQMWERGFTGKGVKVCVIDEGYKGIPHSNLTVQGYNAAFEWVPNSGHTYQMISNIAARNTPGPGVIGNAFDAEVYVSDFYDVAGSISWGNMNGCKVYNCSFTIGLGTGVDLYTQKAIEKAIADGGIICVATGNNRSSIQAMHALASAYGVVTVGSLAGGMVTQFQEQFYNKNILSNINDLDFALPHLNMAVNYDAGTPGDFWKGTSATSSATSQLSGIFAQLFERFPYLPGEAIVDILKSQSKVFTDLGVTSRIPILDW